LGPWQEKNLKKLSKISWAPSERGVTTKTERECVYIRTCHVYTHMSGLKVCVKKRTKTGSGEREKEGGREGGREGGAGEKLEVVKERHGRGECRQVSRPDLNPKP
jgi:hypothetical protein